MINKNNILEIKVFIKPCPCEKKYCGNDAHLVIAGEVKKTGVWYWRTMCWRHAMKIKCVRDYMNKVMNDSNK